MSRKFVYILFLIIVTFQMPSALADPRFPMPEFESGYTQPETQLPLPRGLLLEFLDVIVLILSLSIVTWFVHKKRSRKGVFWMSIFSILYFGFFREGCVCSIGSIQNIALALFDSSYNIPITVIAFFVIPLIYTLFFGRTFCAGVCPLGAIQDIFVLNPLSLKSWTQTLLGLIPFIYLGLSILYAATGTDFIICRYDPFIGIFRLDATFTMFAIGAVFLATSVFIARPYCRFFCPYGVLLNLISRFSKKHVSITPTHCIQCRLCENSCPFGAIDKPTPLKSMNNRGTQTKRFIILSILIPLLMFVGGWTGAQFHETLAKVNPKVKLAQELISGYNEESSEDLSEEIKAFKTSGKPIEQLYTEAASIIDDFYIGGWILGIFIGLVFGLTLAKLSVYQFRTDYTPNKGTCLSCARCYDYCPVTEDNELIKFHAKSQRIRK
ncbi:MAG: 4Fe-4S binding protein [Bacteroidota bacterium]